MSDAARCLCHPTSTGRVAQAFQRDLVDFATAVATTPVEDRTTWIRLRDRWDKLSSLLRQHGIEESASDGERIDRLVRACDAGFAAAAKHGLEDEKAALLVRVTALRDQLGRHVSAEYARSLPIHQLRKQSIAHLAFVVPWTVKDLTAQQRNEVFARTDGPLRLIWLLTHRRFEARETRAFRYT